MIARLPPALGATAAATASDDGWAAPRGARRNRLQHAAVVAFAALAALVLTSCADSRPVAPPPAVSVSLVITLNKWSWIQDGDRQRHAGGSSARPQAVTPSPDHPDHPGTPGNGQAGHGGASAGTVTVEVGYGEMTYDSCPIERFAEKATIQAGFGVRNWIRIRDGERTIEVGSVAGRKGAGVTIELGPGISTSEY